MAFYYPRTRLEGERPGLGRWVRIAHARWRIEMDYRELKEELGLDHFEGRHWLGWHHHVTLVTLAYASKRCSGGLRPPTCGLKGLRRS